MMNILPATTKDVVEFDKIFDDLNKHQQMRVQKGALYLFIRWSAMKSCHQQYKFTSKPRNALALSLNQQQLHHSISQATSSTATPTLLGQARLEISTTINSMASLPLKTWRRG